MQDRFISARLATFSSTKQDDRRWNIRNLIMKDKVAGSVGSKLAIYWSENAVSFGFNRDPALK